VPITKGGTGQTTVAAARNAFGLGNTSGAVPVANGGTGSTTATAARAALGAAASSHDHDASDITSGALPVARGGTGSTSAASARTALGIPEIAPANAAQANKLPIYNSSAQLTTSEPTLAGHAASKSYADSKRAINECDFGNYGMYSQNARNFTVSSNYVSCYLDGGNRFGITPSAKRFKQDITPQTYTLEQLLTIQVVAYRLRAAVKANPDASGEVGVIAEQLIEAGLSEFVVFDDKGKTQSVAYERLVLVAIGGVQDMATRIDKLEARLSALEGAQ
jgi:hypothetical protein